ncbi:RNA polymerase sigma-70 factor (ECF subfamily) [Nocardioides albertanoniae]|uniref:RNA polymerase sigma-70 factor (ECF subfamily) n=1 Tax=Nocardioides albertanoniae TaxID=1175486 RepID=A0A543A1P0_9ACTN|nr:RNA polymerase sigma factor SigJ [Nocardioides albertanoniae]TQL66501.1 RNA polymerase sigma-70 factor (ECF subfamily) [Nocardioides albertanoniae]
MDDLDEVIVERRRLIALAYRLLGTVEEAEDAVQETYVRWYRLTDAERSAIDNPAGWLSRVTSRICLDALKSARVRREQYVGPWLPEPTRPGFLAAPGSPAGATEPTDPADRVTLDDTVSTALLVVLDAMTPAERVAFVLHDVFAVPFGDVATVVGRSPAAVRQLATSARRRVADQRLGIAALPEHDDVVRAFVSATAGGDLGRLVTLLDPSVTLRSDGGGRVSAALNPIEGPQKVARFLVGVLRKRPTWAIRTEPTADGLGFTLVEDATHHGVANLRVVDGRVTDVWIVLNPDKLGGWR